MDIFSGLELTGMKISKLFLQNRNILMEKVKASHFAGTFGKCPEHI
jgi:hypothetical protein